MRLFPPAPLLSRMAVRDDVLCGRTVSAGSIVMIAPWIVHRHRRLWNEPHVFDPRRFLPGRREAIDRFAYLPFGAGPRICIGMTFAIQEMIIVLAHVVRSCRLALAPGASVRLFQCVTLRPRDGMPMLVTQRPSQADTRSSR
jgi:cytochrome P450